DETLRLWFLVFFAAAAAASLFGGTVHGFLKAPDSRGRTTLWALTLVSIWLSGLAAWFAAARLELQPHAETWARIAGTAMVAVLFAAVILGARNFAIAIVGYPVDLVFAVCALVRVPSPQGKVDRLGHRGTLAHSACGRSTTTAHRCPPGLSRSQRI